MLQQAHRLQLIHRPGLGLIAGAHRITGETEDVANAEGMGPEEIRLQANAVSVTAGLLPDRLHPGIEQQPADRQAAHAHHRTAAIGHVHGVHPILQERGVLQGPLDLPTAGGHHLCRQGKVARLKRLL